LHLLLRLGESFQSVALGWHGAPRIELAEAIFGVTHRIAGFADALDDFRIERRKELEQRFQFFMQFLGSLP
jgi:hypothetical protein